MTLTRKTVKRTVFALALGVAALPGVALAQHDEHADQHHKKQKQEEKRAQQEQKHQEQQAAQEQHHQAVQVQQMGQDQRVQERQARMIEEQRQQRLAYEQTLQRQEQLAQQQTAALQQRRAAQYREQQRYWERVREQRRQIAEARSYDYSRDPYFTTAPSYRYTRAGRIYEINQYAADTLRQAVNYGYEEGVRAGEADRQDGYRGTYRNAFAYRDANYGYNGLYVNQGDYNYYFREGFRRGYEDGFSSRYRYGTNQNGTLGILGSVLQTILNLQQLR
jgi:hypothetical protein